MENIQTTEADPQGFTEEQSRLWKRRYQTACDAWKNSKHKDRCENVVRYLHNDFSGVPDGEEVFLNQFAVGLKTLLTQSIVNNPFVSITAENDIVYEYGPDQQPLKDEMGQPIKHDITKTAETIQGLLKKRLKENDFKSEARSNLRNAISFNRGVYLVGHTINAEYNGSFKKPAFHAYLVSVSPRRIKRQPGTTRIDEGTYCFYEYELPVSHLKKDNSYDQNLLKQCKEEVLTDVNIGTDDESFKDSEAGHFDDVKYISLRNAYDFLTGEIFVFGKGCDKPLKTIKPDYSFMNPFVEFVPNETFQPDQKEPLSDLMMIENIVKKAQKIIKKAILHIENFNTGYNIEEDVMDLKQRKRIEKSKDKSFWIFKKNTISAGKVQRREEVEMGQSPFNLIQFLFDWVEKTLRVYNFQQGGQTADDETATKTQAKVQTSQINSGDMAAVYADANNKALDMYLEVLIKTTTTQEVVECIGDAGEVEYRPFSGDEAKRGQYHCDIDLQSMGAVDNVKVQQALKFLEILKTDPDPAVQQKFNKVRLYEMAAKRLGLGNEGIIRKIPDTQGMDEQAFRDYLKQQILKAKAVTAQIMAGATPLPPSPDDDDDIHLQEYLGEAQKLRNEAATNPDPMAQQQAQAKVQMFVQQAQFYLNRKQEKGQIEARMSGSPQSTPGVQVSNQPPNPGQMLGQAQAVGGMQ